jgi:cell division septation protein DedD
MRRRNGYTDFAIPMKELRKALAKAMRDNPRMPHEDLVQYGVDKIMIGAKLYAQYESEFLGYIVTNALNQAEGDVRAAGVNPVTGASVPPERPVAPAMKPEPKPQAKKDREDQANKTFENYLATLAVALSTMTIAQVIAHEELGPARAAVLRKFIGAKRYRPTDRFGSLTTADRKVWENAS